MKKQPTKKQQAMIDEIMESFDFKRVLMCMQSLDWRWGGSVPTLDQIKKCALDKLLACTVGKYISSQSGGFRAQVIEKTQDPEGLELLFVLESSEAYKGVKP